MARHAGLTQVTNVGKDAFHCERRCRVLLRDNRLLGTATSVLLCFSGDILRKCCLPLGLAHYIVNFVVYTLK